MCSMFDEDEFLVLASPEYWRYIDYRTVGCVLVDDMLGSMYYDAKQHKEWENKFEQVT